MSTRSSVMTLGNFRTSNANSPLTVIDIQHDTFKQPLNKLAGNGPQKKGNFTRKIIYNNYKNTEGPQ
jgi:hypothetical protein